jgi:molybdopterin/thiamine biosynthesis adenylyltransferase/rhodanese-related sulfurtransferase
VTSPDLTTDELRRYGRHLSLPEFGLAGQRRLRAASVLVVGAGGLGSPVALYLAAAGVGRLGVIDADRVDVTNLQRQLLHGTADVGRPKVQSAHDRLADVNPHVRVDAHFTALTRENARALVRDYDVVVDASDNFPTRYLVNDACVLTARPVVHGSVSRFEGQASVFGVPGGPCYRCLFPEPPPAGSVRSCAEAGVLGVLPGLVGMIQATEVVKLLTGLGESLAGRLLLIDALAMRFRAITVEPDPLCVACGTRALRELVDYDALCGVPAPSAAPAHPPSPPPEPRDVADPTESIYEMPPAELAARLAEPDPPDVLDVREPWEYQVASIPGARLVPLNTLPASISTIDPSREYVVHCHHGVRSRMAAEFLRAHGVARVANLRGGIDAWSDEVDPSVPQY